MGKVITLGDTGTHDGNAGTVITAGQSTVKVNGKLVAVQNGVYNCTHPGHAGPYAISVPLAIKTKAEGSLIAIDGAQAACGAIISANLSTNVNVE